MQMGSELMKENPKQYLYWVGSVITAGGADHPASAVALGEVPADVASGW